MSIFDIHFLTYCSVPKPARSADLFLRSAALGLAQGETLRLWHRRALIDRVAERVAQTYAFFAFVCGSSSVHGISRLHVNIMVYVFMLRTAEEGKVRLPPRYRVLAPRRLCVSLFIFSQLLSMYALRQHAQHLCLGVLTVACRSFYTVADIKGKVGATSAYCCRARFSLRAAPLII